MNIFLPEKTGTREINMSAKPATWLCAHAYNFVLPQALQIHKTIGRCSTDKAFRMVRAMFGIRAELRGAKAPCISWSSRGTRLQFLSWGLAIACGALE